MDNVNNIWNDIYNMYYIPRYNYIHNRPNHNLYIFGICIDTFTKYGIVITFCFINSGIRAMNSNVLRSWVINEVQDTSNKKPIDHKKTYILSSISVTYNWFDFFMYMNILMSQIDLFVLEILADLIMTGGITNYYLKQKTIIEPSYHPVQ